MAMNYALIALCLIAFCPKHLEAGFSNNGTMRSKNLCLRIGGNFQNNGSLIGTESATLSCGTFLGTGLLQSPIIVLKTDTFGFTGRIDCSEHCTIVSTEPFDEEMFERVGEGEFAIIYEPTIPLSPNDVDNPHQLEGVIKR